MHRSFSLLAFAISCSCPTDETEPSGEAAAVDVPPAVRVDRLRGTLSSSGQDLHLELCKSERPSKVVGGQAELREVLEALEHTDDDPPVPVEVIGAVRDQPGAGTMVAVSSVNVALPPGDGALCEFDSSYRYRAHGNEPFWAVTVRGGQMEFSSPDLEVPIEVPAVGAREPGWSGPIWRGEADDRQIELKLEPVRCWDDMSGAAYPYRAVASLDGVALTGCAYEGWTVVAAEGAAR